MIKREYKKIKLSDLKSYERNNKKHSANVDEIVKSIQANTYISPIICSSDYTILAGHGRKLALDKLGTKEAEVLIISGLSKKQERDFRLRDNKLTELSEWDFENIQFELDEIGDPELNDLFSISEDEEESPMVKDLSDTIGIEYNILIKCKDEISQENLFNKVKEIGGFIDIKLV